MEKNIRPVEMALEAAVLVLQSGGSTVAAERSFSRILTGYKEEEVTAVWRLDFIAACRIVDGQSSTVVRPVGPIGVNPARAAQVTALSERVANDELSIASLGTEIARIKNLPSPHNRWFMMAAAGTMGAAFSQISGGDWGSLAIAPVAVGIGQGFRSELQARRLSTAAVTLICGVVSASIGSVGLRFGFSHEPAATLMASVIYLAPGLPLINGFLDIVSHKYLLVGIERIANAAFLFLILAIAIAFASTVIR